MASPRSAPKPLNLDPRTFGEAPAALYLVEVLNQRNSHPLARKVARVLAEVNELLADLARAHLDYDALSTRSLARLLPMLSEYGQRRVELSLRPTDDHVANLTLNVLEGGLKRWKVRVQKARRDERDAARLRPPGTAAGDWIPAAPLVGEKTPDDLRRRSKRYLERKGKPDTLY